MPRLSPALMLVLATFVGCCMDGTIKFLGQSNHILVVIFGRYLFGALFSSFIWLRAGRPGITAEMWRAHAMRGFVIVGTAVGFFWALTVLPLAEAVTLSFIYPLIIPFAARAWLGEPVRATSVGAALFGFVGVIVAAQGAPPASQAPLHTLGVAAVLFSATMFALAMVLLRARAQTDGAVIVGMMSSFFPTLLLLAPTLAFATPPHFEDWPVFLLMGMFAAAFMYLIAHAYGGAEAQKLAPLHYTELIWASAIGYTIFHETPRPQIYLGAAVIVVACLYTAYQEHRTARASA